MKHLLSMIAVAALTTTTFAVQAADAPASAPMSHKEPHADASFMKDAAAGGMMEVEAGQQALQRGTDGGLKTFAQTMVDDHTKANEELSALAASKGVELPKEPSLTQRAKLKMLPNKAGASFDKHYADMNVSAHKDTIKMFQKEAKSGKDADVRAFASKTLPTLQHHLEMAQSVQASVKDKK